MSVDHRIVSSRTQRDVPGRLMKKYKEIDGEYLHTALRKLCDSPWTSVAWNAIKCMDDKWDGYLEWMNMCFSTVHSFYLESAGIRMVKMNSLSWRSKSSAGMILEISFNHFSDLDWEGYCGFLDVVYVKNKKTILRSSGSKKDLCGRRVKLTNKVGV